MHIYIRFHIIRPHLNQNYFNRVFCLFFNHNMIKIIMAPQLIIHIDKKKF